MIKLYNDISQVQSILKEAAKAIQGVYQSADMKCEMKSDNSPVTAADMLSHNIVTRGILDCDKDSYIVSEEGIVGEPRDNYWLLDPLDGTREFIQRSDDFVIALAFLEADVVKAGFIYHPLYHQLWYALAGQGAFFVSSDAHTKQIYVNKHLSDDNTSRRCLLSRGPTPRIDSMLNACFPECQIERVGSALKYAYLAEGRGDIYFRFKASFEWDSAAGEIIVDEAGGFTTGYDNKPVLYGKDSRLNPPMCSTADKTDLGRLVAAVSRFASQSE